MNRRHLVVGAGKIGYPDVPAVCGQIAVCQISRLDPERTDFGGSGQWSLACKGRSHENWRKHSPSLVRDKKLIYHLDLWTLRCSLPLQRKFWPCCEYLTFLEIQFPFNRDYARPCAIPRPFFRTVYQFICKIPKMTFFRSTFPHPSEDLLYFIVKG